MNPLALNRLNVFQSGRLVATLERTSNGCRFAYLPEAQPPGKPPIAYRLTSPELVVQGKYNLPPFFSGLLPEGVMRDALVSRARISGDDLFSQLALTGRDAVGDITVESPDLPVHEGPTGFDDVREFIDGYRASRGSLTFDGLSGVVPKISLRQAVRGLRGGAFLVKLEPAEFPGVVPNEAATMSLARRAGFRTADVRVHAPDLLVVRRFDRIPQPDGTWQPIHVEDALQLTDAHPFAKYSLDFLEILDLAQDLGGGSALCLDLLRLYVLSWLVGNADLHAKNVSFVRDDQRNAWALTPVYDLVCTLAYPQLDPSMALALDEQRADFTLADLVKVAARDGIPPQAAERALRRVAERIGVAMQAQTWPGAAQVEPELTRRRARFLG